jgi:hypothetical protein
VVHDLQALFDVGVPGVLSDGELLDRFLDRWHTTMPATVVKHPPAYPDRPAVEFFEEEVTWSIRLKVPDDMDAGEKTLKCQASYQLLNDKVVTFPGRWTLGDVRVQVGR